MERQSHYSFQRAQREIPFPSGRQKRRPNSFVVANVILRTENVLPISRFTSETGLHTRITNVLSPTVGRDDTIYVGSIDNKVYAIR